MPGIFALPNLISLSRIPLAVAFVFFPARDARLAIIAAAAGTDFLDGWLARRGHGSRLGAVLDPVTDKAFVVTSLIALAVSGPLRPLELLVLLARDIAVVFGLVVVLLRRAHMRLSARLPGKLATVVQLAALVLLVLSPDWKPLVLVLVGVTSAAAIYDYGREAIRALRHDTNPA